MGTAFRSQWTYEMNDHGTLFAYERAGDHGIRIYSLKPNADGLYILVRDGREIVRVDHATAVALCKLCPR